MDQILLESLGNLSVALEEISKALNSKKESNSAVSSALIQGDFSKVLNEISVSIKEIQNDNKKILENQDILLNIAKEKKEENKSKVKVNGTDTISDIAKENKSDIREENKSDIREENKSKVKVNGTDTISDIAKENKEGKNNNIKEENKSDIREENKSKVKVNGTDTISDIAKENKEGKNNNIKEGVGNVLLIAGAVLALGAAFKIIGKVDFVSVITLSASLTLLAIGFSEVHKTLKSVGFDAKKDSANFIIAITSIALSITLSSWILSTIAPLSFSKFLTMTVISIGFAIIAPSVETFIKSFKGISITDLIKSVIMFPLILPAIALGIALSSWAFQLITPISMMQFLTAVGIGAVFTIISFGIRKILKSFEGIESKDLLKTVLFLPLILPAIALSIALSSFAFQLISPISMIQFLTALGISAIFVIVSFGMEKIVKSISDMKWEDVLKMPAFFTAVSIAIMLSSIIFSEIKIISFSQFLTALGISAIFIVLSFGMEKIVKSISDMEWEDLLKAPAFFTVVSLAIMLSSYILSVTKPITIEQFLTALGISAVFVVLSFGMEKIVKSVGQMKWEDVIKIPAFFTTVSVAIMLSSHILSLSAVIPISKLLNLMLFSATISVAVAAVSGAVWVINKLGLKLNDLIKGGLSIVIISTSIMIASHILSLGNYGNFPDWKWALGVSLSLIAFIPSILILGTIAMTGAGFGMIAAGAGTVLLVAGTITGTAYILSLGKYGNYPSISWSTSVAISMVSFTLGMVTLGALIVGTLGIGAGVLTAGSIAVLTVASTIVKTADIFSKGKYTGGPSKEWSVGVSSAIGAFLPLYQMLRKNSVLSFFGMGGSSPDDFSKAINTITKDIVNAANLFSTMNASFKSPPPKEWAEGVGSAIGAFSPIYEILLKNKKSIFGVSVDDFSKAITIISTGMIESANIFAKNKAPFEKGNYPTIEWGKGVGSAIAAFAPIFKYLDENRIMGINILEDSIKVVSNSIVDSSVIFSKGKFDFYPNHEWTKGTTSSIESFVKIFNKFSTIFIKNKIENIKLFISAISESIKESSITLSLGKYDIYPKQEWTKGVSTAIKSFIKIPYNTLIDFKKSIVDISDAIKESSLKISLGNFTIYPNEQWIDGVSKSIRSFKLLYKIGEIDITKLKNYIINISNSILESSIIFARGKYDIYPNENWVNSISKTISSYLKIFNKNIKDINTKYVSDLSNSIVDSSIILSNGDYSYFIKNEWIDGVSNSLIKFNSLSSKLTYSFFYKNVENVADRLVNISKKIYNNRKYFESSIDENFMKSLSSNILSFVQLSSIIEKQKKEESLIKEALGLDPISRTVNGMVKMASAYDVLAKSIKNLSGSINSLNVEKISSFNSLTGNIAIMSAMDSNMFNNMLSVLEKRSNVFSKLLDAKTSEIGNRPSVNIEPLTLNKNKQSKTDSKGENDLQKLDKIITILSEMNRNVVTIDKFLKDKDDGLGSNNDIK